MNTNQTENLYSEILPGLWQGGTHDFDTLEFPKTYAFRNQDKQFDSVATLYPVAHPVGWGISERRFGFPDAELDDNNLGEIHAISDWAYGEWKSGKNVLIRCQAGLNRSGLCTALVLMKDGLSSSDAIALIRNKRGPDALFNTNFVQYLSSLSSTTLNRESSIAS
jgi:hypothetical protein